ncbi:PBP superfamily domain protein [Roseivivax sp. THAF40]|uniref:helix-turn-helix transcriptional regulator n=1 Tax=unclassified Roseivivax TaxID=2639302 RepID=UPI001268276D|nr:MULTISPECIES: helix-turn-helix transcriptional regulator [unclassified Roseivivax]QFS84142.1 PBP superfamily domain protein [Roseivivax sp. THAF197b]QFT47970.1 PBP superfamily domain protein [Roseivivax sp. THAF40]
MPEFLTVKELAELLRIKERKVYDLAASGAVPCSKVTGKLLFPEAEVRAWIASGRSGPGPIATRPDAPDVILGSHDPLLSWALRQSRAGLATYFDGSMDGLTRFAAGEGIAAGLHLIGTDGSWNIPDVQEIAGEMDAVLIAFARRQRGLVLRSEDQGRITGLADLPGLRVAARPAGTGSDRLLRHALAEAGIDAALLQIAQTTQSEEDAVFAVKSGSADVTFGLASVAAAHGLAFLPVIEERFDLLLDRRRAFDPPLQALLHFLRGQAFRDHADQLGGYDVSEAGLVRWNA